MKQNGQAKITGSIAADAVGTDMRMTIRCWRRVRRCRVFIHRQ